MKTILMALLMTAVITAAFAGNAYAYIDPGAGSYVLQILLMMAAAIGLVVKTFWQTIKSTFQKIFGKKDR